MPERHHHVDLDVLQEVEQLLSRADAPKPDPDPGHVHLRIVEPLVVGDDAPTTSHPSAHVPDGALVSGDPLTPLPRRR